MISSKFIKVNLHSMTNFECYFISLFVEYLEAFFMRSAFYLCKETLLVSFDESWFLGGFSLIPKIFLSNKCSINYCRGK